MLCASPFIGRQALSQWPGPVAQPTNIGGLKSILDLSEYILLTDPSTQIMQGPIYFGAQIETPSYHAAVISQTITTIENGGSDVGDMSLAIGSDGLPIIAFYDVSTESLKTAKCFKPDCTGPRTIKTIQGGISGNQIGFYNDIIIGNDGFPIIAFARIDTNELKVARCASLDCGISTITPINDAAGNEGYRLSMAKDSSGNPIISYIDTVDNNLEVAICGDPSCATATIRDTGNIASTAVTPSIGLFGGLYPFVGYVNGSLLNMYVCTATDCATSVMRTALEVATAINNIDAFTIGSNDIPALAYFSDSTTDTIKILSCRSAVPAEACTTGPAGNRHYSPVAQISGTVNDISVGKTANGLPVVAYHENAGSDLLKVASCATTQCDIVSPNVVTIDAAGTGLQNALAVPADGRPVIAYRTTASPDLKVAKCANEKCISATSRIGAFGASLGGDAAPWYAPQLATTTDNYIGLQGYGVYNAGGGYGAFGYSNTGTAVYGTATAATNYGAVFEGSLSIADNGLVPGTLTMNKELIAAGGLTANASYPSFDLKRTGSPYVGAAIDGRSDGETDQPNTIGIYGYSQNKEGIIIHAINNERALRSYGNDGVAVYGFSSTGPGIVGEVTYGARTYATGLYASSTDRGIWGEDSVLVSGEVYGTATATSTWTGAGIYACGSTNAAAFWGNVFIKRALHGGLATGYPKYVEQTGVGGPIIGKIIEPEITFGEQELIDMLAACVAAGGGCTGPNDPGP